MTHVVCDEDSAVEGALCVARSWVDSCQSEGRRVSEAQHTLVPPEHNDNNRDNNGDNNESDKLPLPRRSKPALSGGKKRTLRLPVDVPRDAAGKPLMPVVVGSLTVVALGTLEGLPDFCAKTALYPLGYCAESLRPSYKHPQLKDRYRFEVLRDESGKPQFRISCGHDPENAIVGSSPTDVCAEVQRRVAAAKGTAAPKTAPSGNEWFGFSAPTVRKLLQELPGAQDCKDYKAVDFSVLEQQIEDGEGGADAADNVLGGTVSTPQSDKTEAADGSARPKRAKSAAAEERQRQKEAEKLRKKEEAERVKAEKAAERERLKEEAKRKKEEEKEEAKRKKEEERAEAKRKRDEEKDEQKRAKEEEAKRKKEELDRQKQGQQRLLMNFVAKAKPVAAATAADPASPGTLKSNTNVPAACATSGSGSGRLTPEQIEAAIGLGPFTGTLPSEIPRDYLKYYSRSQPGGYVFPSRKPAEQRVRVFKHCDDEFRPCFSKLWTSSDPAYRRNVSGRNPFREAEGIDYDDESDCEWEGWDQLEDIEDEMLAGSDEENEGMEEGIDQFIVPDGVLVMEDDAVIEGVRHVPRKKEVQARIASITPVCLGSSNAGGEGLYAAAVCFGLTFPIVPTQRPAALAEVDAVTASSAAAARPKSDLRRLKPGDAELNKAVCTVLEQKRKKMSLVKATEFVLEELALVKAHASKAAIQAAIHFLGVYVGGTWELKGATNNVSENVNNDNNNNNNNNDNSDNEKKNSGKDVADEVALVGEEEQEAVESVTNSKVAEEGAVKKVQRTLFDVVKK